MMEVDLVHIIVEIFLIVVLKSELIFKVYILIMHFGQSS